MIGKPRGGDWQGRQRMGWRWESVMSARAALEEDTPITEQWSGTGKVVGSGPGSLWHIGFFFKLGGSTPGLGPSQPKGLG